MNHSGRNTHLPDAWALEVTKKAETQEGSEHPPEQPAWWQERQPGKTPATVTLRESPGASETELSLCPWLIPRLVPSEKAADL